MRRILLIGAGFTRNWGGWLASEFVGELCGRLVDRLHLNEALRVENNFEKVLGDRRTSAASEPGNFQAGEDVSRLEAAIMQTFRDINLALKRPSIEFSVDRACSIKAFLSRFDAIFSLNQDLFFELHYAGMELEGNPRKGGFEFPGIVVTPEWLNARASGDRIDMERSVGGSMDLHSNIQPIFKLHGSVDWRSIDGRRVLIIGTGKEEAIAGSDILRLYMDVFRGYLWQGGTEVMVLGYGFADEHINRELLKAAREYSMKMYLVNPAGLDSFRAHPQLSANGRNELLEIPLIGVCQRSLSEVFRDSQNPAFRSFQRFVGIGT